MAVGGVGGGDSQGVTNGPQATGTTPQAGASDNGASPAAISRQLGASGDVEQAVAHIHQFPGERDNVERAMVASGRMREVHQLEGLLQSQAGQPQTGDANPTMLNKDPHTCTAPYARAEQEFEDKGFFAKFVATADAPAGGEPTADMGRAKLFERECEKLPDRIPASTLDSMHAQINDYTAGRTSMSPEAALRLRSQVSLLEDTYRPGPRLEAPITPAESAWLADHNLRTANDLTIGFLGPVFGGFGAATRVLGGNEQQVAAANDLGASLMDIAAAHVAAKEMAPKFDVPLRAPETVTARGEPPKLGTIQRATPEVDLNPSTAGVASMPPRPDLTKLSPTELDQLKAAPAVKWDTLRQQRDQIPEKSGVYIFSRTPGDITTNKLGVLYVGKAGEQGLRSRLPAYLADPRNMPLMSSKRPGEVSSTLNHAGKAQLMVQIQQDLQSSGESHIWVRWIETDQPTALEDKLIQAYQPAFNTAGVGR